MSLEKYMAKKKATDGRKDTVDAPEWKMKQVEGHMDTSTDDFETKDTEDDPLEDAQGPESKKSMTDLDRFQRLKDKDKDDEKYR